MELRNYLIALEARALNKSTLKKDISYLKREIETDVTSTESKLKAKIEPDLEKMSGEMRKWGTYYIVIVVAMMLISGIGSIMTKDFMHFLVEILPTTVVALILGLVFLKRGDETVKTSTAIVHKSLASEISEVHAKLDVILERLKKDEEIA